MKAVEIFVAASFLVMISFFGFRYFSETENQKVNSFIPKDVPPLHLVKANQNIYPQPVNMVSLVIYFENEVTDVQEFANRVYLSEGIVEFRAGKGGKIFQILFDPGYTSHADLITAVYSRIDDPSLFVKKEL